MAQIIHNENITWEQVLYFLDKKDNVIDNLVEDFWGIGKDGSVKLGVVYYLEKALDENKHITEIEIPMKKNEANINYDIIRIVKQDESITWYKNNEPITKQELMELWTAKDISIFEKNLAIVFEKLHYDRSKTIEDLTVSQRYIKRELNTNANKC